MSQQVRRIIMLACGAAVAGVLLAYVATGAHAYTRFRDAELEATNEQTDLSDLFAETGAAAAPPSAVESVNAIGLLPSGPGLASLSVATVGAPALVVIGVTWWLGRRQSMKARANAGAAKTADR